LIGRELVAFRENVRNLDDAVTANVVPPQPALDTRGPPSRRLITIGFLQEPLGHLLFGVLDSKECLDPVVVRGKAAIDKPWYVLIDSCLVRVAVSVGKTTATADATPVRGAFSVPFARICKCCLKEE